MPVFHTKTIESILEPVAQQVIKVSGLFPRISCLQTVSKYIFESPDFSSKNFEEKEYIPFLNLILENFIKKKLYIYIRDICISCQINKFLSIIK